MRKLSTLFFALLISSVAFGQAGKLFKKSDLQNNPVTEVGPLDYTGFNDQEIAIEQTGSVSTVPIGTTTTDAVTSIKIGEASNAYTFLRTSDNQLSTIPDVGTMGGSLAFIHRQNINGCGGTTGDNGRLRYTISTDGGNTWNYGSVAGCFGLGPINPLYTQQSRYPNAALFLEPGATPDPANFGLVYVGPVLAASGSDWDGVVLGTVMDPNNTVNVTQEIYPYQAGNQYFSNSITERVPGEFWYVSTNPIVVAGNTINGPSIHLNKGIYDSATNQVNWSIAKTYNPNYSLTFDGSHNATARNIAFSPDGMTGYVVFLGDLAGNQDSVYAPCWASTTDGGVTWSNSFTEFNYNQFNNFGLLDTLNNNLFVVDTVNGDTSFVSTRVTTGFDCDVTVDKNGNPHIITLLGPANFTNFDGTFSDPGYTISNSTALGFNIVDITPDAFGDMNMIFLSRQATFRGEFGDFVTGGNAVVSADPYTQISRSPAGDKVFFFWTDSDTTTTGPTTDNTFPNLIGRGFDVDNNTLTQSINYTLDDLLWTSRALMPKIPPVSFYDKASTHTIPTVIMNLDGNSALSTVSFYYFQDVTMDNSDFTITPEFLYNCKENPITANVTELNPDCGMSDGSLVVTASGGLGSSYSYEWSANAGGATADTASNLSADIYTVTVIDSIGCFASFTSILNNANAPTLATSNVNDISCNGAGDGTATVNATGGTGTLSYLWDNGETDSTAVALGPGPHTVTVTDANGCESFITVNINEPQGIVLSANGSTVDCNGDVTGTASAAAVGGTGSLTYSWSNGATTPTLSGLAGGDYTVYVTDASNCVDSTTATVNEPEAIGVAFQANPNTNATPTYSGNITATPSGGTAPYVVDWTGPDGYTAANMQFIFGLCGGEYVATITDANGCVFTDTTVVDISGNGVNCVEDTTIGIDDELRAGINNMNIIPNPNQGTFVISLELNKFDNVTMELIDLSGKTIVAREARNVAFHEESFNLTNLSSGIYLIKVKTSFGYASRKLVIN